MSGSIKLAAAFSIAALLSFSLSAVCSAQGESSVGTMRPTIEKEDIFDRLAPLVEATVPEVVTDHAELIQPAPVTINAAPSAPQRAAADTTTPDVDAETHAAAALSKPVRAILTLYGVEPADDAQPPSPVLQAGAMTELSQEELHQLIDYACASLWDELGQVHFGDRWQDYLRLKQVSDYFKRPLAIEKRQGIEQRQERAALAEILAMYDRVAGDAQYQPVSSRAAFVVLHEGLAEYLASAAEREKRRKSYHDVSELFQSLQPVPTGRMWHSYFALNRVAKLLTAPRPLSPAEKTELQLILARFEKAADEPRFKTVAKLPGFAPTHQRLQLAVAVVPDDEVAAIAHEQPPGKPVPVGAGPHMHLIAESPVGFYRAADADGWAIVERAVDLASGSAVRTNSTGSARLTIGTKCQAICAPDTLLRVAQFVDEENRVVTQLHVDSGNLKLAIDAELPAPSGQPQQKPAERIVIVHEGHEIIAGDGELELEFRHEAAAERVIAAVYAGSVQVRHHVTGDTVNIRAGREAVMMPAGIAVRAAGKKPVAWWPSRRNRTAEAGPGFSR